MPGPDRPSDRWLSITLSVLLHAGVIGLIGNSSSCTSHRPPHPAGILGFAWLVVDAAGPAFATVRIPAPPPQPAPQPPPVEEVLPPEPTPDEIAQRGQAAREQA